MEQANKSPEARLDRIEYWVRNQRILSLLIFVGVAVIGIGEVVRSGSEILTAVGLKSESALELANDNAKSELSRRLIELAWRRIFWTRNFYTRVESRRPQPELDYSWNKLMDCIADWSADYMVFMNSIERYYPKTDKATQLRAIQIEFLSLDDELRLLRNLGTGPDNGSAIKAVKDRADKLNEDLYFFALAKHSGDATK